MEVVISKMKISAVEI